MKNLSIEFCIAIVETKKWFCLVNIAQKNTLVKLQLQLADCGFEKEKKAQTSVTLLKKYQKLFLSSLTLRSNNSWD